MLWSQWFASLLFVLGLAVAPAAARAQTGADPATVVNQFRDTLNLAKIKLLELDSKRGSAKTTAKREALELLSRAWIMLQRIPADVQESEDLLESTRAVEDNLKDLGSDPRIKRIKDDTLVKGIKLYREGSLSDALMLFEELRMMDPTDTAVSFLVRYINQKLDEEAE